MQGERIVEEARGKTNNDYRYLPALHFYMLLLGGGGALCQLLVRLQNFFGILHRKLENWRTKAMKFVETRSKGGCQDKHNWVQR